VEETTISAERYAELGAHEQFVLAVTERGFGKRTSAYEYRVTGRGGQGIIAIDASARNGDVVALFPIEETDQIMLVTNTGQMIRCPVDDVRIAGRATQGVTIFRVDEGERVVSVERIGEAGEGEEGEDG
jgi:DNA gyrase subunit A